MSETTMTDAEIIALHARITTAMEGTPVLDQITALVLHAFDLAHRNNVPLVQLVGSFVHIVSDLDGPRPLAVLSSVVSTFIEAQLQAGDPDAEKLVRDRGLVYEALKRPTVQRRAQAPSRFVSLRMRRPRG